MKVGDILICKKDVEFFEKGEVYTIEIIDNKNILIGFIYDNYWFNTEKVYGDSFLIWDYFYTLKESRKLKLDKIEKI